MLKALIPIKAVKKTLNRLKHPALIFLLGIFAFAPLFHPYFIGTHDGGIHLERSVLFTRAIREGTLVPRWDGSLSYGYGYPIFIFYAPLVYYASAFFSLLGFDPASALKLTLFSAYYLSGLFMYLWARRFWGKAGGLVSAVAYIYAPYHILDIYVRGSAAEFAAMAFFPAILFFLQSWSDTNKRRYLAGLALSYGGLIATHNISALVFTPVIIACLFLQRKGSPRGNKTSAVLALAGGLALSAFYWAPALYEMKYIHAARLSWAMPSEFSVYLFQLFSPFWSWKGASPASPESGLSFQLGALHYIVVIASLYLILSGRIGRENKRTLLAACAGTIILSLMMLFPFTFFWDYFPLAKNIQFPWRLLSIIILGPSLAAGYFAGMFGNKKMMAALAVSALFILFALDYCSAKYYKLDREALSPARIAKSGSTTTVADEYAPVWTEAAPAELSFGSRVVEGEAEITVKDFSSHLRIYEISSSGGALVEFGHYWYPGWYAFLGGKNAVLERSRAGLMRVRIPAVKSILELRFKNTPFRLVALLVSCAVFLAVAIYLLGIFFISENITFRGKLAWSLAVVFIAGVIIWNYFRDTDFKFLTAEETQLSSAGGAVPPCPELLSYSVSLLGFPAGSFDISSTPGNDGRIKIRGEFSSGGILEKRYPVKYRIESDFSFAEARTFGLVNYFSDGNTSDTRIFGPDKTGGLPDLLGMLLLVRSSGLTPGKVINSRVFDEKKDLRFSLLGEKYENIKTPGYSGRALRVKAKSSLGDRYGITLWYAEKPPRPLVGMTIRFLFIKLKLVLTKITV